MVTPPDTQRHYIIFYGYEEDAQICSSIFAYAVDCVRSQLKVIKNVMGLEKKSKNIINRVCETYGKGFYEGLDDAYTAQDFKQEEEAYKESGREEWGLVMSVPAEVKEILEPMERTQHKEEYYDDHRSFYAQGYEEGKVFTTLDKLAEVKEDVV